MIVNPAGTGTPSCVISARPIALAAEQLPAAVGGLVEVVDESITWVMGAESSHKP